MSTEHPALPLLRETLAPFVESMAHIDFEDLLIQKPGEAWIRIGGVMQRTAMPLDATDLEGLLYLAASLKQQNVGRHRPLLSADLPGGVRVQGVLPPCVNDGTVALAIRRPKGRAPTMKEIVAGGMFAEVGEHRDRRVHRITSQIRELVELYHHARATKDPAERGERWERFFRGTIAARLTHVLCGTVGTGKTHFSMGLADFIDHGLRLATIQDADEWAALPHPNRVDLFYSKGEQGAAAVAPTDLVEACLRMSMDWLLMQEVRGAEAFGLMRARRSGHPGITTCHAESTEEVFPTLALMAKMHDKASGVDLDTLEDAWRGLIDVVVHFHRPGGQFRVSDVWFRPAELGADAQQAAEAAVEVLTETLEPEA